MIISDRSIRIRIVNELKKKPIMVYLKLYNNSVYDDIIVKKNDYKPLILSLLTFNLPIQSYSQSNTWKSLFHIKGISNDLLYKLLYVLHYYVIPCLESIDMLECELDKLKSMKYINLLWTYVQVNEGNHIKMINSYNNKNSNDINDVYNSLHNRIWSFIDTDSYENILHKSIDDDYIQSTYFICNIDNIYSDQINQRNVYGETVLHKAARQLKINHLKILIKASGINLNALNKNNQNFLHVLFINLQTRWNRHQDSSCSNVTPSRLQIVELLNSLASIKSTFNVCDLFYSLDAFDSDVLMHCLSIKSYVIVHTILKLFPKHNTEWGRYINKAILTDKADIVTLIANNLQLNSSYENENSMPYLESLSRIIVYAIEAERYKSLQALLNISIFKSSINIVSDTMPLLIAIDKVVSSSKNRWKNNADEVFYSQIVRLLLRHGANVFQRLSLPCGIDNYFSYAARLGSDDILRQLLLAVPSTLYCFSRYDAEKMENIFFVNEFFFYSNPIVEAVRSKNNNFLEYIIEHSVFKSFINEQDVSGHNPITIGCIENNIDAIRILLRKGANVMHKLFPSKQVCTSIQQKLDTIRDTNIEIDNVYRTISNGTIPNIEKLSTLQSDDDKVISELMENSKSLLLEFSFIHKEEFYSLPEASKSDESIKKFLDCLLSILRLRLKKLSASEVVKTFLRLTEVKKIFSDIISTFAKSISSATPFTSSEKSYIDIARKAVVIVEANKYKWHKQKNCRKLLLLFGKWFQTVLNMIQISDDLQAKMSSDEFKTEYLLLNNIKRYSSLRNDLFSNQMTLLNTKLHHYPLHYFIHLQEGSDFDDIIQHLSTHIVDKNWWKDAASHKNWKFVQLLVPNILQHDQDYETLVVDIAKASQIQLLAQFSKHHSYILGKTFDHLCASVDNRDGNLFLALLVDGVYNYHDINFWDHINKTYMVNKNRFNFNTIGSRLISMFQIHQRETLSNGQLSLNENNTLILNLINDVGRKLSKTRAARACSKVINGILFMHRGDSYYNLQSSTNNYPLTISIDDSLGVTKLENFHVRCMNGLNLPSSILQLSVDSIRDYKYLPSWTGFGICTRFLSQHQSLRRIQQHHIVPLLDQIYCEGSTLVIRELSKLLMNKKCIGCIDCKCSSITPVLDSLNMAATHGNSAAINILLSSIESASTKDDVVDDLVRYRCYKNSSNNRKCSFTHLGIDDEISDDELLRYTEVNMKLFVSELKSNLNAEKIKYDTAIDSLKKITSIDAVNQLLDLMRTSNKLYDLSMRLSQIYELVPKELSACLKTIGIGDDKDCHSFVNDMSRQPIVTCIRLIHKLQSYPRIEEFMYPNVSIYLSERIDVGTDESESRRKQYNLTIFYKWIQTLQRLVENEGSSFLLFCESLQSIGFFGTSYCTNGLGDFNIFTGHPNPEVLDNIAQNILVQFFISEMANEKFSITIKNIEKNMDSFALVNERCEFLSKNYDWLPLVCLPLVCLNELDVSSILTENAESSGPNLYSLAIQNLSSSKIHIQNTPLRVSELMRELWLISRDSKRIGDYNDEIKEQAHELIVAQLQENIDLNLTFPIDSSMNTFIDQNTKTITSYFLIVAVQAAARAKYAPAFIDIREDFLKKILIAGIKSCNAQVVQSLLTSDLFKSYIPDEKHSSLHVLTVATATNNIEIIEAILSHYYGYCTERHIFIKSKSVLDINNSIRGWSAVHSCLTGFESLEIALSTTSNKLINPTVYNVGYWINQKNRNMSYNQEIVLKKKALKLMIAAGFDCCKLFRSSAMTPFYPSVLDLIASLNFWDILPSIFESQDLDSINTECSVSLCMHSAMMGCRNDLLYWIERKFLETKKKKEIDRLVYVQRMAQLRTVLMSKRTFVIEKSKNDSHLKSRKSYEARMNILHPSDQIKYTHSILHDAILAGDNNYCIRIIKLTIDIILSTDNNKVLIGYADHGLLHYATYKNMPDVVRLLIQPPWSLNPLVSVSLPFREMKGHLWNPLQIASYKGNLDCLKMLMDLSVIKTIDVDYIFLQNLLDSFKLAFYSRKDECSAGILCWFQAYYDKDINLTISILNDEAIYFSVSNQMNKTLNVLLSIATSIIKLHSIDSNICSVSLVESLIDEFYLLQWEETMLLLVNFLKETADAQSNENILGLIEELKAKATSTTNIRNDNSDTNESAGILNDQSNHQILDSKDDSRGSNKNRKIIIIKDTNGTKKLFISRKLN